MASQRALGSNQDFIVSLLRSQVKALNDLLGSIEQTNIIEEHVQTNLKQVEVNILGLRKLCADHY